MNEKEVNDTLTLGKGTVLIKPLNEAKRITILGNPGAGKSTFVNAAMATGMTERKWKDVLNNERTAGSGVKFGGGFTKEFKPYKINETVELVDSPGWDDVNKDEKFIETWKKGMRREENKSCAVVVTLRLDGGQ